MILKALFYSIAFALAIAALPSPGASLEVTGSFIQGGLATGRAAPGTRLFLDGKAVPVSPEGYFMLGFGRDVPSEVVLREIRPHGGKTIHRLTVRQRVIKFSGSTDCQGARLRLTPQMWRAFARRAGWLQPPRRRRRQPLSGSGFAWPAKGRIAGCMAANGF